MSLDTALTPTGNGKEEIALARVEEEKENDVEGTFSTVVSLIKEIRTGRCPHYDDCIHPSKAPNYYCLQDRCNLVLHGRIICYQSKAQEIEKE